MVDQQHGLLHFNIKTFFLPFSNDKIRKENIFGRAAIVTMHRDLPDQSVEEELIRVISQLRKISNRWSVKWRSGGQRWWRDRWPRGKKTTQAQVLTPRVHIINSLWCVLTRWIWWPMRSFSSSQRAWSDNQACYGISVSCFVEIKTAKQICIMLPFVWSV